MENKINLPNAVTTLVLGIGSIFFGLVLSLLLGRVFQQWLFGFGASLLGLVCGIVALPIPGTAVRLYRRNATGFSAASHRQLVAGRVCGIVGISLSGIV